MFFLYQSMTFNPLSIVLSNKRKIAGTKGHRRMMKSILYCIVISADTLNHSLLLSLKANVAIVRLFIWNLERHINVILKHKIHWLSNIQSNPVFAVTSK